MSFIKPKLLTEQELHKELEAFWDGERSVTKMTAMIQDQKFAHADSIVGNVENHNAQCTQYRKVNRDHSICLCNAKARNNLRLEQREINKGVLNV